MGIDSINRNVITKNVSSAYTALVTDDQIIGDCTSAGFTVTLYQVDDGATHHLVVAVDPADVSGNVLTITDGSFSTTLQAAGASVTLETQYDGTWMIAGEYPVTSSATATSSATSAGLAASVAESAGVSGGDQAGASTAQSVAVSGSSMAASVATSQHTVQSTTISTNLSTSSSAVLSGVSATASVATSQNLSQSANVSSAFSLAAS